MSFASPALPPATGSLILCDQLGKELDELEVDHTLRWERSRAGSVKFTLPYNNSAIPDLFSLMNGRVIPQVRAYRRGQVAFAGYWAPHQETLEASGQDGVQCEFRTPFSRLETRFIKASRTFTDIPDTQIASGLISTTNSESATGLHVGTVEDSTQRTATYAIGIQLAQTITDLTDMASGMAFVETFVNSSVYGYLSVINLYAPASPNFGKNLTAYARFEAGDGTIDNVVSMQRTVNYPINQAIYSGGGTTTPAIVNDMGSQAAYGLFSTSESDSNITVQAHLVDHANKLLQPDYVQQVSFAPDVNSSPQPIDDYWLNDTVGFYVNSDGLVINANIVINAIEIDRDGSGNELAHRLEFGHQRVRPLRAVRRGRKITFREQTRT